MTRAYIRIDPGLVENLEKKGYPDQAIATYLAVLCAAERQDPRGVFMNIRVLVGYLSSKRRHWVGYLLRNGDLSQRQDGSIYVEGWAEWQEGNILVAERMRIVRARKTLNGRSPDVTSEVTSEVTRTVTPPPVRTLSGKPLAVSRKPRPQARTSAHEAAVVNPAPDGIPPELDKVAVAELMDWLMELRQGDPVNALEARREQQIAVTVLQSPVPVEVLKQACLEDLAEWRKQHPKEGIRSLNFFAETISVTESEWLKKSPAPVGRRDESAMTPLRNVLPGVTRRRSR